MNTKKQSSRVYSFIRGGVVACLLPVFFIYILVGKPDYKILDSVSGIVVPVAGFVSDGITFPVRLIGKTARSIREHNIAKRENIELRRQLDELIAENQMLRIDAAETVILRKQLNITSALPQKSIIASITHDNSAIAHGGFIINMGQNAGIKPNMVAVSMQGSMVGIVTSVATDTAKVRAISDAKSSIPVRVSGTDVYGFMSGGGVSDPSFEFYSDPEFMPTAGNRLVTSGIKGTLPAGIPVGIITKPGKISADVQLNTPVKRVHDVIILLFDNGDRYK